MHVRNAILLTALAVTAGSVSARPDNDQKSPAPAASAAKSPATSLADNILSLAGEWDGSVDIRWSDKETSSSIAGVSCRRTEDGRGILAVFEGFARGEAFRGVLRMSVDPENNRITSECYDSRNNAVASMSGALGEVANACVVDGKAEHEVLPVSERVRQVARFQGENECSIEWFIVGHDGKETLSMRLNLSRMAEGQVSSAAALFDDARLLNRIAGKQNRTANAEETH